MNMIVEYYQAKIPAAILRMLGVWVTIFPEVLKHYLT